MRFYVYLLGIVYCVSVALIQAIMNNPDYRRHLLAALILAVLCELAVINDKLKKK